MMNGWLVKQTGAIVNRAGFDVISAKYNTETAYG